MHDEGEVPRGGPDDPPATETALRLPGWGRGAPPVLERGDVLGRYLILDRLGAGGMGVVYSAYDPELDRKIAVKLLRTERASADARAGLLREAQAMARLSHPNVVAVHDVGTFGDRVFLAMELVDGCNLRQWMTAARRSRREVLEVFVKAGRGLAAAHAVGLVHRDFKPENVLLGRDGRVRVADFGLARLPGGREGEERERMGTPGYVSPEQFADRPADARSDQFAFCVCLYEALYGERPFRQGSFAAPEPPPAAKVPAWLRRAVLKGLSADPADRFSRLEDLLTVLESDPEGARRRRMAALGTAAVVGGGLLGIGWILRERAQLCRGGEERLAGVWDAEREGEVRRAFLATGAAFARDAADGVGRTLDRYARSWTSMHREACEATRLRGEQSEEMLDLRMGCLTRRLEEVRALVDLFARADFPVVEKAVAAAGALSSVEDCGDVAALAGPIRPPAGARSRIEKVRAILAAADALRKAGRYAEALKAARLAEAEAGKLDFPPLAAESLYTLGDLHDEVGDFKAAAEAHRRAVVLALAGKDARTAARAAASLQRLHGVELADAAQAKWWGEFAAANGGSGGGDDVLRAGLLYNDGIVLRAQGRLQEAAAKLTASLALWEKVYGRDHLLVAATLNSLASALADQGRYAAAEQRYGRALAIFRRLLGPAHPDVAKVLANLGTVARNRQDYPRALRYLQQALAVNETALGADHPEVNLVVYNLANVLSDQDRSREALAYYRRALAFDERHFGPDHPNVAEDLSGIGNCLAASGDLAAAEPVLRRALHLQIESQGGDHPSTSFLHLNLAGVLFRKPDYAQALEHYRRALAIAEKSFGANHRYVGEDLKGVGLSLLELGRAREALAPLERSLAILQSQSRDGIQVATVRFSLAKALWETGIREGRPLDLARQARAACAAAARSEEICREIEDWLARVGRPPQGA